MDLKSNISHLLSLVIRNTPGSENCLISLHKLKQWKISANGNFMDLLHDRSISDWLNARHRKLIKIYHRPAHHRNRRGCYPITIFYVLWAGKTKSYHGYWQSDNQLRCSTSHSYTWKKEACTSFQGISGRREVLLGVLLVPFELRVTFNF